jgi:hypothetical protein
MDSMEEGAGGLGEIAAVLRFALADPMIRLSQRHQHFNFSFSLSQRL